MQQQMNTVTRTRSSSVLQTNSVIRNTYLLLSLTLMFSAGTAWFAMVSNAPYMGLMVLPIYFGLLFLTQALRNSVWGIFSTFLFTGFMGYTLGPILNATVQDFSNGSEIVMTSLGLTGVIFVSLSAYALTTRKDFSYLGGFLFVGAIVAFIAGLATIFFQAPILYVLVSGAFILISSGMILFQTSAIINGGERNYIMATITLYISLYNIFLSLLRILSMFSGRR